MAITQREKLLWKYDAAGIGRCAVISKDGRYRYVLGRRFPMSRILAGTEYRSTMIIIGANPSTADAEVDDATIRRDMSFARREQCEFMFKLNLGAYRATKPEDWQACHENPCGPDNDEWLTKFIRPTDIVVAAWGSLGSFMQLGARTRLMLNAIGIQLKCFGLTKDGHPRHTLYTRSDCPLVAL